MAEQCFRKKDSNPPVCGIHEIPLQQTHTSDPNPNVRFFVCPASGKVIKEMVTN
jgi:hypothetical protein